MSTYDPVELVYLDRGKHEGLIRRGKRDAWNILSQRGNAYAFVKKLQPLLPEKAKALLLPVRSKLILFDRYDPVMTVSIMREMLLKAKSPYDVSLGVRKAAATPLPALHVENSPELTEQDKNLFERLFPGITKSLQIKDLEILADIINLDYISDDLRIMFVQKWKYEVMIDLKEPSNMVLRMEEIFNTIGSNHELKLVLRDYPVQTYKTEVA